MTDESNELDIINAAPTEPKPTFALAPQQLEAAEASKKWFESVDNREVDEEFDAETAKDDFSFLVSGEPTPSCHQKQIFKLFGYAGTGKTTTIRHNIAELDLEMGSDVLFAAFTGKAALVMRRNGLPASTIHSLIYKPVEPDKKKCEELFQKLKECTDEEEGKRIRKDLEEAQQVTFHLRTGEETALTAARLLVLDECSMVGHDMLKDVKSFGVPILVLGDPGQLPPIEGESPLVVGQPDILLTEIHRQAKDNPIISFATRARNGIYIPRMSMGTSAHVDQENMSEEQILSYDQILTGKNATRQTINLNVRKWLGRHEDYPMVGDKLICLKNDAGEGLYNGLFAEVLERGDILDSSIEVRLRLESEDGVKPGVEKDMKILRAHFDAYRDKKALDNVRWWERRNTQEFDYGYAITVHKSQGSQWNKVLLWDDKFFKWGREHEHNRRRWLYTGITRAVDTITIAS